MAEANIRLPEHRRPHLAALDALERELIPTLHVAQPGPEQEQPADIAKLSAEAMLTQYDQTAKGIEELGTVVKDLAGKLQAELEGCNDALKLIAAAAAHVREKGDATHTVIAEASSVLKIIRETCADFTNKVS
jgi:ribonuclease HII